MSVSVGQARLKDAQKLLQLKWDRTREVWNDAARQSLEQELMGPLPTKIAAAMGAMSRLGELVSATRRECQ